MNWNELNEVNQLATIDKESESNPVMILKHSTRCSISTAALERLNRKWAQADYEKIKPYYLDLLAHRDISNAIESRYKIEHQSPQVLIISNGKCIYSETHSGIRHDDLMDIVAKHQNHI